MPRPFHRSFNMFCINAPFVFLKKTKSGLITVTISLYEMSIISLEWSGYICYCMNMAKYLHLLAPYISVSKYSLIYICIMPFQH